jgi:hypothetical protein
MFTKPMEFGSDRLGARSHLRWIRSSKSETGGVVFEDSGLDQRLGILFESESRSHFVEDETKGKEDAKSLTEENIFGLHGGESSLGLKFAGPRDRDAAKGNNEARARLDGLGIIGIRASEEASIVRIRITVQDKIFGGFDDHVLLPSAEKVATNAFQGDAVRDARILRKESTLMIGKREFATRIGREIHILAQNRAVVPVFVKGSAVLVGAEDLGGGSVTSS